VTNRPSGDKTPLLPLGHDPAELRSGLRVTRAQFARLLGVSRQTTSMWAKAGKITIGADGRLDPRVAVAQLLRHSDPGRLRAKVLAPLIEELSALRHRVAELEAKLQSALEDAAFREGAAAELEAKLQSALEDAAFHEGAADELVAQQKALLDHLGAERAALSALSGGEVVAAVEAWLRRAAEEGRFDPSMPLLGQGAELESRFAEEADAFGDDRAPLTDAEGPMPGNTEQTFLRPRYSERY
jgi:DNA-binding XRE family transcriptional regulator/antitoxin component HigA of HigAB toxin-antitoxin module